MHRELKTLLNYIVSDFKTDEYASIRKMLMINSFLIVGMVAFFSFALINIFLTNKYLVSVIDIIAFSVFFFSYKDLQKNKNIYKASIIGSVLLILFMIIFIYLNHNVGFGLIWTIFISVFTISLFGSKTGLKISLFFYAIVLPMLLYGVYNWNDDTWNLMSFLRFTFASLVLVFVVYMTENSFEKISNKLKKLTNTDSLTNLYNRRKIDEIIANNFHDHQKYKTKLCIAIFDIDNFKNINDEFGHAVGDEVLIDFAKILKENSRQTDFLGRWGGEEFILIMKSTELKDAVQYLNKLKTMISSHNFNIINHVTCSIGVCQADELKDSINKLFICADKALYNAKINGKNLVSYN